MTKRIPPKIKKYPILKEIWVNVFRRRMNQIILVNGLPRTGKSELCLWLGYMLDPNFSMDNIAFTYRDFLTKIKESKKVGDVLIWEEAGTIEGANARKFFSESNVSASSLFQSLGWKRQIAIINLPCKIMLDKHVRLLVHAIIDTKGVDYNNNVCRAKFYWARYSASKDIQYRQSHVFFKNGILQKVTDLEVGRAPKPLRREYMKLESEFKNKLQAKLERGAIDGERKIEAMTPKNEMQIILEKVKKDVSKYWDKSRNRPLTNLIRAELNISLQKALGVAALMKRDYAAGELKV